MCGRYALVDIKEVYSRFEISTQLEGMEARGNVTPMSQMPVVTYKGKNQLEIMNWGMWEKVINARVETVNAKPAFKQSLLTRRCLIPANGFYEWDKLSGTHKPYYFSLKNESLMAMAGIYDQEQNYAIITTRANPLVGRIHERMPVILEKNMEQKWLESPALTEMDLKEILKPLPEEAMLFAPVTRLPEK